MSDVVVSSRASVLCGVTGVLGVIETIERPAGAATDQARVRPTRDLHALERVVVVRAGDDA